MPTKKPRSVDEKPQRERFIEAAREAQADETDESFERAFRTVTTPKSPLPGNPDKKEDA